MVTPWHLQQLPPVQRGTGQHACTMTSRRLYACVACAAQENAARLKAFRAKLVLFPRRSKKPKSGDASAEELGVAQQHAGPLMPLVHEKPAVETVQLTDEMKVRIMMQGCIFFGQTGRGVPSAKQAARLC